MRRVSANPLQASTLDIINVIRQNASAEYQNLVPEITKASDIPKVGEVLQGYPACANQFINALVNRIALVVTQSATFNNPYNRLKKGYLEYGETVEEIFVSIAKVKVANVEKAPTREFKRTIPDVKSAFHIMNWQVMYPVTIQEQDLNQAFLSAQGVTDLISKIVNQIYVAYEYDEFLLFKYLIIKGVNQGKFKALSIGDGTDLHKAAISFRGTSNQLTFMSTDYNETGVMTNTPRDRQVIFMDANFNAQYDVEVLSAAFNMDKATFSGSLFLIDDFTKFDNDRFAEIRAESDMIDEVTSDELAMMKNVKAVLLDEDWFQVYDNLNKFTETYVSSGLYWNYFYHVRKTISTSPFANAITFVTDNVKFKGDTIGDTIEVSVTEKSIADNATVITLNPNVVSGEYSEANPTLAQPPVEFVQTQAATENGVAVHTYGAIMFPPNATGFIPEMKVNGHLYRASTTLNTDVEVNDKFTFTSVN